MNEYQVTFVVNNDSIEVRKVDAIKRTKPSSNFRIKRSVDKRAFTKKYLNTTDTFKCK
jgi:hypothetical protein